MINKESEEIPNLSNTSNKIHNPFKEIYMQKMDNNTMSCINLFPSKDYIEKRIVYSVLPLIIDSTSQVLLLATYTIKKINKIETIQKFKTKH